jgi:hypothetical protein
VEGSGTGETSAVVERSSVVEGSGVVERSGAVEIWCGGEIWCSEEIWCDGSSDPPPPDRSEGGQYVLDGGNHQVAPPIRIGKNTATAMATAPVNTRSCQKLKRRWRSLWLSKRQMVSPWWRLMLGSPARVNKKMVVPRATQKAGKA